VSLEFNCVNQEANEVAHCCAKIVSSSLGACEWQHHVLDFLLGVMARDYNPVNSDEYKLWSCAGAGGDKLEYR
jgi:hypothetical protein